MTQTVSRLFDNPASAQAAAAKLKSHAFTTVHVVSAGDGVAGKLSAAKILPSHAAVFSDRIGSGATLVSVQAQLGTAQAAIDILRSFGPIDSGLANPDATIAPDDPAPLSDILGFPTLVSNDDSFSRFWGLPLLSKSAPSFGSGAAPVASKPFNGTFGIPMISTKAAPFSSMLGLPTLTGGRR